MHSEPQKEAEIVTASGSQTEPPEVAATGRATVLPNGR
jgi:hypothetical protein